MNLEQFCGDPDSRHQISTPFRVGEFDYATDGRIMIRVPSTGDHRHRDDAPNAFVEKYFSRECGEFSELPAFDVWKEEDLKPCSPCGGTGDGEFGECQYCDGWGFGTGERETDKVELLGGFASDLYLSRIMNFPNIRIAKCVPWPKEDGAVYHFAFDGGEGVLMGMR